MLTNYLKMAWRNLLTSKGYTAINIIGLALGLSVCLVILLYIFNETSYDKHHTGAGELYRINTSFRSKVDQSKIASSNPNIAEGLKSDFPEVEQSARLLRAQFDAPILLEYTKGADRKTLYEKEAFFADPTFFDLFTYRFLEGDARTALAQPNTVVLSEQMARTLFGNSDPMGKVIRADISNGYFPYRVTGVVRSLGPSHIDAHVFLAMTSQDITPLVSRLTNWATYNIFYTYFRLKKGTDATAFEKKLNPFLRRHGNTDMEAAGAERLLSMQRVTDIHLHSDLPYEIGINGNITYLYILGSIAVFVLIIACVNFMNLATARSQGRAREVGVRKVMGALRYSLVIQFLCESMLLSVISLLLALFLVRVFLPVFNNIAGLELNLLQHPVIVYWMGGLTLLTGLLAGVYPAFYLSSFRPILVLKGKLTNNLSALIFRKGLVVFQFTISVFLILASLIIGQQMNFLRDRDLGFQKDQQLAVPLRSPQIAAGYDALHNALVSNAKVVSVTKGSTYPGLLPSNDNRFYKEGQTVADGASIPFSRVGYGYLETLGIKLVAGRAFSKDFPSDSTGIILNETAIRTLRLDPATAVGTVIHYNDHRVRQDERIIGIAKDFNFKSLRESISPYGFVLDDGDPAYLIAHVNTTDYPSLISDVTHIWQRINPGIPFEYSFIDQDFQRNYEQEYKAGRIIRAFTVFAIFIACLGLFGLAAFTAEQRRGEIGIRKVLGSSISGIVTLLSKDFIRLVFLSILIACPLAAWAMHRWLQDFAYRTPLSVGPFLLAGIMALLVALLTVTFQAVRAARANPINGLRAE